MQRLPLAFLALLLSAALAAAQERTQVTIVNGTAEADFVEIMADGSARLRGRVLLHAERLGPENAAADVTAERVTIFTGTDKDGRTTITKLFARGQVHIEAVTRDEAAGETRNVVSDCDEIRYLASEEVVHFLTHDDDPVTAHVTVTTTPNATNNVTEARTYDMLLTARETLDFRLTGLPADELEAETQG